MPFARAPNGRRYSTSQRSAAQDWSARTPDDPRPSWPDSRRNFTETTLLNGTVLRTYEDPPLREADTSPKVDLPDVPHPDDEPAIWRGAKLPKLSFPDSWTGPLGPLPPRGGA